MSREDRKRIVDQRNRARGQQVNTAQTHQHNDGSSTVGGGPPTTIEVNQSQGQRSQANTQGQASQQQAGNLQPGTMFRNVMSSAAQRSAQQQNADTISVNGSQHRRVTVARALSTNATVHVGNK